MKDHIEDTRQPWVGLNGGLAAVFALLVGSQAPCTSGFERKAHVVAVPPAESG
jgi:hypothetical protein